MRAIAFRRRRGGPARLTAREPSATLIVVFGLGASELLVILVIVLVLFGGRRLPEIGSGVGKAIKNFKSALAGKDEIDVTPTKKDEASGRGPSA